jgi:GNAT superfamily N-acetyltransferase
MIQVISAQQFPLTQEQITYISEVTHREPNLSYRQPKALEKHASAGHLLLAVDGKRIVGWIERYPLWQHWWGLSSLYVEPKYRDKGVGRGMLLPAALKSLRHSYVYAATTNQLVWEVLEEHGCIETTLWKYPLPLLLRLIWLRYTNFGSIRKLMQISKKPFHYYYRSPQ